MGVLQIQGPHSARTLHCFSARLSLPPCALCGLHCVCAAGALPRLCARARLLRSLCDTPLAARTRSRRGGAEGRRPRRPRRRAARAAPRGSPATTPACLPAGARSSSTARCTTGTRARTPRRTRAPGRGDRNQASHEISHEAELQILTRAMFLRKWGPDAVEIIRTQHGL